MSEETDVPKTRVSRVVVRATLRPSVLFQTGEMSVEVTVDVAPGDNAAEQIRKARKMLEAELAVYQEAEVPRLKALGEWAAQMKNGGV